MASIAGLSKLGLPRLSRRMDPEAARVLRTDLSQTQGQLQDVLPDLDTEDLAEGLKSRLEGQ